MHSSSNHHAMTALFEYSGSLAFSSLFLRTTLVMCVRFPCNMESCELNKNVLTTAESRVNIRRHLKPFKPPSGFGCCPSLFVVAPSSRQTAEKVMHIKGRLLEQATSISSIALLKFGTSLKGKNSLPKGANSFL